VVSSHFESDHFTRASLPSTARSCYGGRHRSLQRAHGLYGPDFGDGVTDSASLSTTTSSPTGTFDPCALSHTSASSIWRPLHTVALSGTFISRRRRHQNNGIIDSSILIWLLTADTFFKFSFPFLKRVLIRLFCLSLILPLSFSSLPLFTSIYSHFGLDFSFGGYPQRDYRSLDYKRRIFFFFFIVFFFSHYTLPIQIDDTRCDSSSTRAFACRSSLYNQFTLLRSCLWRVL